VAGYSVFFASLCVHACMPMGNNGPCKPIGLGPNQPTSHTNLHPLLSATPAKSFAL